MLSQIAKLLEKIGAGEIRPGGGGSDIQPLVRDGVAGLSESTVGTHYFDWHHTEADTLDKVNIDDFRKNVAVAGGDELRVGGYARARGRRERRPGRKARTVAAATYAGLT